MNFSTPTLLGGMDCEHSARLVIMPVNENCKQLLWCIFQFPMDISDAVNVSRLSLPQESFSTLIVISSRLPANLANKCIDPLLVKPKGVRIAGMNTLATRNIFSLRRRSPVIISLVGAAFVIAKSIVLGIKPTIRQIYQKDIGVVSLARKICLPLPHTSLLIVITSVMGLNLGVKIAVGIEELSIKRNFFCVNNDNVTDIETINGQ